MLPVYREGSCYVTCLQKVIVMLPVYRESGCWNTLCIVHTMSRESQAQPRLSGTTVVPHTLNVFHPIDMVKVNIQL